MTMISTRMLIASMTTLLGSAAALTISIASPALAQANNPPGPPPHGPMHHADFLNLTDDQKAQLEQIHQNVRSQIDAILTDEQKTQLQRDRANRGPGEGNDDRGPRGDDSRGRPPRSPFDSLNLSEEQRSQIDAIMSAAKEQMDTILTPEQRQQLQEHEQQRQQRRPGNS